MDNISGISGKIYAGGKKPLNKVYHQGERLPQDSVTLTKGPLKSSLKPGQPGARASTREIFFRDNIKITSLKLQKSSKSSPGKRWAIDYSTDFGAGKSFLDNNASAGYVAQSDQNGIGPFGKITRIDGGWLCEKVSKSNNPAVIIGTSKLTTFLSDAGEIEMTLVEMHNSGGGVIYRLDGESCFNRGADVPRVLETYIFDAQEKSPAPPFPFHSSPRKRELSSCDRFFGPGLNQAFMKKQDPSQKAPLGGWQVSIKKERYADNKIFLDNSSVKGFVSEIKREFAPRGIFESWERVEGGWISLEEAEPTPENFNDLESAFLKTELTDDGAIFMSLFEDYSDGKGCVFILDSAKYLQSPGQVPPVLARRQYEKGQEIDEKSLRLEVFKKEFIPAGSRDEKESPVIEHDENWLIVGDAMIPIKKNTDS